MIYFLSSCSIIVPSNSFWNSSLKNMQGQSFNGSLCLPPFSRKRTLRSIDSQQYFKKWQLFSPWTCPTNTQPLLSFCGISKRAYWQNIVGQTLFSFWKSWFWIAFYSTQLPLTAWWVLPRIKCSVSSGAPTQSGFSSTRRRCLRLKTFRLRGSANWVRWCSLPWKVCLYRLIWRSKGSK